MRRAVAMALLAATAVAVSGCGVLHGSDTAAGKGNGKQSPTATAQPPPSARPPAVTPFAPTPTVSPPATPPPGDAQLRFAGALSGWLLHPRVVCEQMVPQGGDGFMAVYGSTLDGDPQAVTIWSSDATTPEEIYEGSRAGDIAYGPLMAPDTGVTAFDWARGATVHATLPPASGRGAALQVDGTITCP